MADKQVGRAEGMERVMVREALSIIKADKSFSEKCNDATILLFGFTDLRAVIHRLESEMTIGKFERLRFLSYLENLAGEKEKAMTYQMEAVSLAPESEDAWIELAFLYREEGDILTSNWILYNLPLVIREKLRRGPEIDEDEVQRIISELRMRC